jgi:hypothetical protein
MTIRSNLRGTPELFLTTPVKIRFDSGLPECRAIKGRGLTRPKIGGRIRSPKTLNNDRRDAAAQRHYPDRCARQADIPLIGYGSIEGTYHKWYLAHHKYDVHQFKYTMQLKS